MQKYRNANARHIVIQIGGVHTTLCQEEGILLQKYRDRNGRCIAILFGSIGVRGRSGCNKRNCWPDPSAEMCRGFLLYTFWRILLGILLEDFLSTFSRKNEDRSLRHDNKLSRQKHLHFQNFIVVALPMKNSVFFTIFPLCPQCPPPLKTANFIFIVVSPSLRGEKIGKKKSAKEIRRLKNKNPQKKIRSATKNRP